MPPPFSSSDPLAQSIMADWIENLRGTIPAMAAPISELSKYGLEDDEFMTTVFDYMVDKGRARGVSPFFTERVRRAVPNVGRMALLDFFAGGSPLPSSEQFPSMVMDWLGGTRYNYSPSDIQERLNTMANFAQRTSRMASSDVFDQFGQRGDVALRALMMQNPEFTRNVIPPLLTSNIGRAYAPIVSKVLIPEIQNQYRQRVLMDAIPWWKFAQQLGLVQLPAEGGP